MTQNAFIQTMKISLTSYTNSDLTNYTFEITPTVPMTSSNLLTIQFPAEIIVPKSPYFCFSTDISIFDSVACTLMNTPLNAMQVTISLRNGKSQINTLETFHITVTGVKNSNTTKPSSQFNVAITDQSYKIINQCQAGITVSTNTASTILTASITQSVAGAG